MATPKKVVKFLEDRKIKYELIEHRTVYTAYDKAATLRVPQKIIGKTLVVKLDTKEFILVLIQANKNLDKVKIKKAVNVLRKKAGQKAVKKISFAKEVWIKKNLKGVKLGAIPPFGKLWKLSVFIDRGLLRNSRIIVSAGDYNWSIKISSVNFKKLEPDLIAGSFSKVKK